jgi:hypothetical protein
MEMFTQYEYHWANYSTMTTDPGTSTFYHANGSVAESRLNSVLWESFGFNVGIHLPHVKYKILGRVAGIGCGTLALACVVINFIPINDDSRLARAYQQAVGTLPGATSLINVDVREDWFWWVIATTRCTLVTGDAIREAGL